MFALAAEDRSVLSFGTQARAVGRTLGAALLGAGMGLGLGAVFLYVGLSDRIAEHARAERMAELAASPYAGSYLEAQGRGLRLGLEHYGFGGGADASTVAKLERGSVQARRRADLECMTDAVYYEARSESPRGQAAVAQVVLNRVKHPAFPKTVCGVVFQGAGHAGCQFSFACDGSMRAHRESEAWNRARSVAARALAGVVMVNIGQATHYHTTACQPFWAPQMLRVAQVGAHVFYKFSPYRLRAQPLPELEQAVLTSGAAPRAAELRIEPAMPAMVEKAVETSLAPVQGADPKAKPAQPAPKPSEAAQLTTSLSAVAAAS